MKIDVFKQQEKNILKNNKWISVGQPIIEKSSKNPNSYEIIIEINPRKGTIVKRSNISKAISEISLFGAQLMYTKFGD